jgi:hypothetical protein
MFFLKIILIVFGAYAFYQFLLHWLERNRILKLYKLYPADDKRSNAEASSRVAALCLIVAVCALAFGSLPFAVALPLSVVGLLLVLGLILLRKVYFFV